MSKAPISIPIERYVAIDAHKYYVMVGGLNAQQETVLPVRKVDMENYPKWSKANLRPGDVVEQTVVQPAPTLLTTTPPSL